MFSLLSTSAPRDRAEFWLDTIQNLHVLAANGEQPLPDARVATLRSLLSETALLACHIQDNCFSGLGGNF